MKYRREKDSLGECKIAEQFFYGIQTHRALDNMAVSGKTIACMPELIKSLAMVKKAAAITNEATGVLPPEKASAITQACDEIISGLWRDQFVVDPYQGGAGTSTNMNANEVIANRALELLGHKKGEYEYLHPLNHVNRSQSTNDSYATAVRLSLYFENKSLITALERLKQSFQNQANRFADVIKLGRTQLQDAVPMTVGAELQAFSVTIDEDIQKARSVGKLFLEVNLGGTAIGSGVGATPAYSNLIIKQLSDVTGLELKRSRSLYEASWDMGAFVSYSSMVKRIAVKLSKICNDLRLLSSGPQGGLGEYILQPRQAGSSIMPGKVNPVIPELMNQVCFKAFGADTTITFAAEAGQLQLNAMEPLIVWTLSETIDLIISAMESLRVNCIDTLKINVKKCADSLEKSTALATFLVPHIGYDRAAALAYQSLAEGIPFKEFIAKEDPELTPLLDMAV